MEVATGPSAPRQRGSCWHQQRNSKQNLRSECLPLPGAAPGSPPLWGREACRTQPSPSPDGATAKAPSPASFLEGAGPPRPGPPPTAHWRLHPSLRVTGGSRIQPPSVTRMATGLGSHGKTPADHRGPNPARSGPSERPEPRPAARRGLVPGATRGARGTRTHTQVRGARGRASALGGARGVGGRARVGPPALYALLKPRCDLGHRSRDLIAQMSGRGHSGAIRVAAV